MEIWIVFFLLVLMTGGTKSQDQTIYLDDGGTAINITSPNYPSNYDNNVNILWKVVAPIGFRIRLKFSDFNLEEWNWDFLKVYLGFIDSLSDATLRATLSGSSLPDDISSTGSYMWLHFKSDGSDTRQGFSASVSTIEPEFIFLTSEETINSPNYPGNYPNNVGMWWEVTAPTGIRISLQFIDFEISTGDYLTVYLGLTDSLSDAKWRATHSRYSLPGDITSTGSYMWLYFTSDYLWRTTGFSVSVSTIEPDRQEVINLTSVESIMNTTSPNYPNDYDNNVGLLWQVIAPSGFRIRVQFSVFDLDNGTDSGEGDSLIVYHGLTNSSNDATLRALLSGSSLPLEISSIGSYLWLLFTSDYTVTRRGFSLSVSVVKPDWACDFQDVPCQLVIDRGSWEIGNISNYYYILTTDDSSSFTINHTFTSREGLLSFARWQQDSGSLNVTVCKTQGPYLYRDTHGYVVYEYASYKCESAQDIEITFTATGNRLSSVLDIQLYETLIPVTETTTLSTDTNTRPSVSVPSWSTTQPKSPQMSSRGSSTLRGQNTAAIAAACSVVALVVLVVVIIIVCIRKRLRNPKTAAPHEKDEDESNLYNNPVYCSNDGGLPIPDLIVGTTSNDGRSTLAPLKPADVDSQSEEFEGHRHLNTNIGDSQSHGDAFSGIISESGELNPVTYYSLEDPSAIAVNDDALNEDDYHTYEQAITPSKKPDEATTKVPKGTGSLYQDLDQLSPSMNAYSSLVTKNDLPKHGTQNGGKDGQTDGSAVLDDELEYNALNFNKSSDVTRALKTPAGVSDIKANNGYGVLDLPKEGHSEQSTQLHNDDVYNTIGGSPHEQDNTKQPPPESFSGYQALNNGPPDPQISRQGLNPQRVPPVSPGEYQSLSLGPKGSGPKMEASGSDQPDDESEYHSYQDPRQMDMNGSVPREPNAFSSDQYNILNSGKEVGDYHVYQSTTEDGMDEGTYEDFNSKTSHDDEYSTVNQMKIQDPKAVDAATFEPIYSEEVYSEFQ